MLTTILFDLDGTLLPMDQEEFIKSYFNKLAVKLAPYGYEADSLVSAIWQGIDAMVMNDGSRTNEECFWDSFASRFGAKVYTHKFIFEEFYLNEFQEVAKSCGFTSKAKDTVDVMRRAGYQIALATNPVFPAVATESRIRWAGLDPSDFVWYTTYENCRHCKPNPEYYRDVLSHLNVTPEECLMVGNDVAEDMIAAALGMPVFLLTDCLINKMEADLNQYPHGGFSELITYIPREFGLPIQREQPIEKNTARMMAAEEPAAPPEPAAPEKIRIITDSASDIIDTDREDLTVLPLTIRFGDTEYQDGVNLSREEFYEKLIEEEELPQTSQLTPYDFSTAYEEAKAAGETVIVITMSAKLSGTYQSALLAAQDYDGMVYVVDSANVTVGEHALVEYALRLVDSGLEAVSIVSRLEADKNRIRLVALLDTLEYLKKGGRISAAAAMVGGVLNIKPVIAIEHGEVAMLGKARGSRQGNNLLVQQIEAAGGIDFSMPYFLGYTGLSDALLQKYIWDSETLWKDGVENLSFTLVGGAIGTHVGPGAIAVAFFAKEEGTNKTEE
ncbi:MAG: DegV family EDD domain-containing protein [Lachnospiraceae bacterium]|nr:DegV family EDD domain-containing protein [Lachnospiraceae bacterium]